MPGIEKLHLEDAFDDAPQTRSLLGVFQKDARILRKYTATMQQLCQRMLGAQREMCAATQALSAHLKSYGRQNFALDSDDSILTSTLQQFAVYFDELSSMHQVLATQMGDGMMYPINKFLQADLDEVLTMGEMYQISTNDHEQAIQRYMKFPKKKEADQKLRQEVNEDLYIYRRKFHQTALHLFSSLNAIQYKRKVSLLEPLIGYMEAQRTFFSMGKDSMSKTDVDDFMGNISASIQGVQTEMSTETKKTVELMDNIEKSSSHLYHADPPPEMPFIPPNLSLSQKAGYLYLRSKIALITTKWERCYFFIQGGNLMCQPKEEVAGSLILDLNEEGTHAEPAEIDDRRHILHVVSPRHKKTVVLQAENARDRDEWVATINNVVLDGSYIRANPSEAKKTVTFAPSPQDSFEADTAAAIAESLRRINPFDQSSGAVASQHVSDNSAFCQTFNVRFLGSMEVKSDRGEQLVHETIRQIMAARAIHNVFKMTESLLMVSSEAMRLVDPASNTVRTEFALEDISFWAVHKENKRLFGFITRTKPSDQAGRTTYACHVFECNTTGEEICQAIHQATRLAFEVLMQKRNVEKQKYIEQQILLNNIQNMEDMTPEEKAEAQKQLDEKAAVLEAAEEQLENLRGDTDAAEAAAKTGARLSVDGQYLILDNQSDKPVATEDSQSAPSPVSPDAPASPITEEVQPGDSQEVESESEA